MDSRLFFFILALLPLASSAQDNVKYYKDKYLSKETTKDKAKYEEKTGVHPNSTAFYSVKDLTTGEFIYAETKEGEPLGKVLQQTGRGTKVLDFDFVLNYTDTTCAVDAVQLPFAFLLKDDKSLNYQAPTLDNKEDLLSIVSKNMFYPRYAMEHNEMGKVLMKFTILKTGEISNISVVKGVTPSLDKEAVRVMRLVKFATPAIINGQPVDLCTSFPLSFRMG